MKSNILIVFLFFIWFSWVKTFQLKDKCSVGRAKNETESNTNNSSKTILKRVYIKAKNSQSSQSELPRENTQQNDQWTKTLMVRAIFTTDSNYPLSKNIQKQEKQKVNIPEFNINQGYIFHLDNEAYTVEKTLGKGGLGLVCLVKDKKGSKQVAKFPLKEMSFDIYQETEERINDIMLKTRENNCENIIKIHNYGYLNDLKRPVLLMEYIEGSNGEAVHFNTLKKNQIKDIMILLTKGLQCFNEKMHRYHSDFKLMNFMVDKNFKATIIDIEDAPTLDEYSNQFTKSKAPLKFNRWPDFFPHDTEKTKEFVKTFDQFTLGKAFCQILIESVD